MQLQLIVKKGSKEGEIITIDNFPFSIGRGDQSSYQMEDAGISRTHCIIDLVNGAFVIRDTGSTNGTIVNGYKISEGMEIRHGDIIIMGKVVALKVAIVGMAEVKFPEHTAKKASSYINQTPPPVRQTACNISDPGKTPMPTITGVHNKPLAHSSFSDVHKIYPSASNQEERKKTPLAAQQESEKHSKIVEEQNAMMRHLDIKEDVNFPSKEANRPTKPMSLPTVKVPAHPIEALPENVIARELSEKKDEHKDDSSQSFIKRRIDVSQTSILMPKDQLHHSYRALKTIYEVLQTCNNETNTERLLSSLLTSLFKAINADRGAIVLNWKGTGQYEVKVFIGEDEKKRVGLPISRTILEDVIERGLSVISESPTEDIRYKFSESIRIQKVQSMICSPLISHEKVFGAIYLDRTENRSEPFKSEDLELLSAIGIQAGAALEKALLLEEVTRMNSYLQAVIESVPVGIHTLTLDGIFWSWSSYSQKLFGYSTEEIIANAHLSVLFPDPRKADAIFSAIQEHGVFVEELPMVRKDKSTFLARFALSRILDYAGNPLGYTGYHQDITQETQLREQMFSQEKLAALGMLAAGVAHDFNNILSLIQGYASMALDQMTGENRRYIDKVITHTQRAAEISTHLLQYSRQETKQLSDGNLTVLVQEVLSLVEKELYASSIKVTTDFQPLPNQQMVPGQIQEVFLNIILNARDAMPNGGSLTIKTWAEDGKSIVSFEDTGEGIRPENLSRIFEPFFSTKKKTGKAGTGLGLAVSYQIMQKHGGTILVNTILGKGTTFNVVLPIQNKSESPKALENSVKA